MQSMNVIRDASISEYTAEKDNFSLYQSIKGSISMSIFSH